VLEFGDQGDEFFLIIEGQCEVLVPGDYVDEYKKVTNLMRAYSE